MKMLTSEDVDDVMAFLVKNRSFLEPFEPKKHPQFYTKRYQRWNLDEEFDAICKGETLRLWLFRRGACGDGIIGAVALNNILYGSVSSAYIGYKLDEDCQGMGYMTEAVNKAVSIAFDELGLHRVEADIMPRNAKSISLIERCGFVYEGTSEKLLQINGVWEDHLRYAILNRKMD